MCVYMCVVCVVFESVCVCVCVCVCVFQSRCMCIPGIIYVGY